MSGKKQPTMHCKICGEINRRAVCKSCIKKSELPCPACGKPTPSITCENKPTKSNLCVSCRTSKAQKGIPTGKICRVCKKAFYSDVVEKNRKICDECDSIVKECPRCGKPMSKYRIDGNGERAFCSTSCASKSIPHSIRTEASKKGNEKKWIGHVYKTTANRLARDNPEFAIWRKAVFTRDNFTCQKCGAKSGNGKKLILHPHHIKQFAYYPELRFEVNNGITLCADCHAKEHVNKFYGRSVRSGLISNTEILNT